MAILIKCVACNRQFRVRDAFRGAKIQCPACKKELTADGPHVRGHDAFISYSSKEKHVADAICAALESKHVRCWIAPRDIPAGASWASAIIEGIEDSHVLLLVYSAHSNQSDQVLREVERAVAKRVPIVPVRIDAAPMAKGLEYFISAAHWMDAIDPPLEAHLPELVRTVRRLLAAPLTQPAQAAQPAQPGQPTQVAALPTGGPAGGAAGTAETPAAGGTAPSRRRSLNLRANFGSAGCMMSVALSLLVVLLPVAFVAMRGRRTRDLMPNAAPPPPPPATAPTTNESAKDAEGGRGEGARRGRTRGRGPRSGPRGRGTGTRSAPTPVPGTAMQWHLRR